MNSYNWVPIKTNIFCWRAEKERIASRVALCFRGVNLPSTLCPMCGNYEESAEHLLVSCSTALMVWSYIATWCKIHPFFAFSIKDLLEMHNSSNVPELMIGLIPTIEHFIVKF
ncbi:hypothetical protein QVD17_10621 [Tagetes erecta]|uniref:Reverse transcriptase zinc-binding domain-containing protein n=1 Tax=Tagetes erecta TaxID=13708 RepID=A0AAD8L6P1_TARER|nr:hypothetical protein QVD17_10621 [Tagetes erecta]